VKSELELLLEKNAYGEGLTREDKRRAVELIVNPEYTEGECWACGMFDEVSPVIYDTGLCQRHVHYALETRK